MEETRRKFLKTGCAVVAGATVASGLNLMNAKEAKASPAPPPYGWPVGGLDVEASKDLGYLGYKGTSRFSSLAGKECASGAFASIIGQLQEAFADTPDNPYHGVPLSTMAYASGGVAGFASLCGALNGAAAAINLICAPADAKNYIKDLFTWYSETALPVYPSPKYGMPHAQSVAESNLCHVSVTKWCLASGNASGSSERSDRCACLVADVVGFVVSRMNADVKGVLGNPRDNSTVCGQCHYKGSDYAAGQFTRGLMNCETCHVKITKASENGHHGGANK